MKFHYSAHRPSRRKIKLIAELVVASVIVIGVASVAWFIYSRNLPESSAEVISTPLQSVDDKKDIQSLVTDHFKFQASSAWRLSEFSGGNKYVYVAEDNNLVEQDLTIYIGAAAEAVAVTRVLPVTVQDGGLKASGQVSDHCRQQAPAGTKSDLIVRIAGAELNCDSDGTLFNVSPSQIGGSSVFSLQGSGGQTVRFSMVYRDLRFTPTGRDFLRIVNSFEVL